MKFNKLNVVLFIMLIANASCTKVIDLKLGNDAGKLVVEANLTQVPGAQFITLTKNVPFTNTNTYPPVTGATVSITDGNGSVYPFTEINDGTYASSPIAGVKNHTYTLNVTSNGTSYTAQSTMPQTVTLDSITFRPSIFNTSKNRRLVTVHFQDPPGVKNQYRFVLWVNSVQVKSVFAFNDDFTDGRYANIDLIENDIDIYPGDTVKVEMQCIDKPIYTYWFTLMQQNPDGPGGGVAPSNPPTNITPAALGYFSAHTTQTQTITVH